MHFSSFYLHKEMTAIFSHKQIQKERQKSTHVHDKTVLNRIRKSAWCDCQLCHHHHQSLSRKGRWGTTDDFATSFLHFSLFSTALWDLPNSRPVHSLMLSSHLFLCLPCLLPPFTVPWKMVLARAYERGTCPYHCCLRLFTMVRSSCGPIACWILARNGLPPW